MVEKKGDIPVNARVDVDYSNGKPKVKFGYTTNKPRKQAIKQHMYGKHSFIFFVIFSILAIYLAATFGETISSSLYLDLGIEDTKLESCSVLFDRIYSDSYPHGYLEGAEFICDKGSYSVIFKQEYYIFGENEGFHYESRENNSRIITGAIKRLFITLLFLAIFYGGIAYFTIVSSYFFTKYVLLRSKEYRENFPKKQAGGKNRTKKYYKYGPKDLLENVIVVPYFKNVELDYKTSGEFSIYLDKIRIREYRYYKSRNEKIKGKINISDGKWYAVFIFKKKPTTGYLEVYYQ